MKQRLRAAEPILRLFRTFSEDQLSVYAGNAVFFLALSVIPSALLLLGLLHRLPPRLSGLLFDRAHLLSTQAASFLEQLLEVADPIVLISVSAVTALWAASRGIYGIRRGLNRAFRLKEPENRFWLRIRSMADMLLILLCLPCSLFIIGSLSSRIPRKILSFLLSSVFIWLLYRFLPCRRYMLRELLPGIAFTAAAWSVYSAVYKFYLTQLSRDRLAGGLSDAVVTLLWLYCCMELLFMGAAFCRILHEGKVPRDP